jgi:serine/threonine-protein kinase
MPMLEGKNLDEAVEAIQQLGLTASVQRVASDEPVDRVVDQRPDAKTPVPPGSDVVLIVSRGPDLIEIPNLEGRSIDLVRPSLEEAGLRISVRERRSDERSGTILDQKPEPGARVPRGTELQLTVAR